jgi:hypothetical protein
LEPDAANTSEPPRRGRRFALGCIALAVLVLAFMALVAGESTSGAREYDLPSDLWSPAPVFTRSGNITTFTNWPDVRVIAAGPAAALSGFETSWGGVDAPEIAVAVAPSLFDEILGLFGRSTWTEVVASYVERGERTVVDSVEWARYVRKR